MHTPKQAKEARQGDHHEAKQCLTAQHAMRIVSVLQVGVLRQEQVMFGKVAHTKKRQKREDGFTT